MKKMMRYLAGAVIAAALLGMLTGCTSKAERAENSAIKKIEKGEYADAIENLSNAIEKAKTDDPLEHEILIESLYLRGDCYAQIGREEAAMADYELAVAEDEKPKDASITLNATRFLRRGTVYLKKYDYANALQCFREGLNCQECACDQELRRNVVICCEKVGDWEGAKKEAENYVVYYPDDEAMENEYHFLLTR